MNHEREILAALQRQREILEQLSMDFHLLCVTLGELAKLSSDSAEDDDEPEELPEKARIREWRSNIS